MLKQPPIAKALFAIEPGRHGNTSATTNGALTPPASPQTVLEIRPVKVSPPFDGVAFVYKTAPSQFAFDYYNNFVASPSSLLTGDIVDWLQTNAAILTIGPGTSIHSDLSLEFVVTNLLIDFSDKANPKAEIAGRAFILKNRPGGTIVVSDATYDVAAPVANNDPAGYAAAWGKCLREILEKMDDQVRVAATK
jgi:ABC-type uncharacterized transport system auxiliary subunit